MVKLHEDKVRDILPMCLQGSALAWHSNELSELKKDILPTATYNQWYNALIRRFKERTSMALRNLQMKRYMMADARNGKDSHSYAQVMFCHVKAAEMRSVHNQLTIA